MEKQYLDLCHRCITEGVLEETRTGTKAKSLFGCRMEVDLSDGTIPLLTTKKMPWKMIVKELLWIRSGSTDSNILSEQGCPIWDANGTIEYLDSIGLTERRQGDLGPVYGFQWRHWGARYYDCKTDYTGEGIDQLQNVINTIKTKPTDRRIILSAWNVEDLAEMALPPCHMFCQFYVSEGSLSCQMYQRSADMGLGVPFNIVSYSILTRMIAQVCGLKTGKFIHVLGNTHVYSNHTEQLQEQMKRNIYPSPTLSINPSVMNIDDFKLEHFSLSNYICHPAINMEMSV